MSRHDRWARSRPLEELFREQRKRVRMQLFRHAQRVRERLAASADGEFAVTVRGGHGGGPSRYMTEDV